MGSWEVAAVRFLAYAVDSEREREILIWFDLIVYWPQQICLHKIIISWQFQNETTVYKYNSAAAYKNNITHSSWYNIGQLRNHVYHTGLNILTKLLQRERERERERERGKLHRPLSFSADNYQRLRLREKQYSLHALGWCNLSPMSLTK